MELSYTPSYPPPELEKSDGFGGLDLVSIQGFTLVFKPSKLRTALKKIKPW